MKIVFACMEGEAACLELLTGGIELVGCEQGKYGCAYECEPSEFRREYDD